MVCCWCGTPPKSSWKCMRRQQRRQQQQAVAHTHTHKSLFKINWAENKSDREREKEKHHVEWIQKNSLDIISFKKHNIMRKSILRHNLPHIANDRNQIIRTIMTKGFEISHTLRWKMIIIDVAPTPSKYRISTLNFSYNFFNSLSKSILYSTFYSVELCIRRNRNNCVHFSVAPKRIHGMEIVIVKQKWNFFVCFKNLRIVLNEYLHKAYLIAMIPLIIHSHLIQKKIERERKGASVWNCLQNILSSWIEQSERRAPSTKNQ